MILSNKVEEKSFVIDIAKEKDSNNVCKFFRKFNEVSFCDWQNNDAIKILLRSDNNIILIACSNEQIIGMLCGGILGTRASVNHIAVEKEFRNNYIAKSLLIEFEKYALSKQVKRIFCFVHEDNQSGISLWQSQGFEKKRNEITLEKDIS